MPEDKRQRLEDTDHPEIRCPICEGSGIQEGIMGKLRCGLCDGQGWFPIFTPPEDPKANA